MELDDLKVGWKDMDHRLEVMADAMRMSLRRERSAFFDRTRSKLRFVGLVFWVELALAILAVVLAGSYLADRMTVARFALPAALLHLACILLIGSAVWQLVLLGGLDFGRPVVESQRRLARLRLARARTNRWLLLASPLLWSLLAVVVPDALIGLDVYREFGWAWVGSNLAFGVVVLGVATGLARRFPDSKFFRWLGKDLTGERLAQAAASLDGLGAFAADAASEEVSTL